MSEPIPITCPRCKHRWNQLLEELEKPELIIYRGLDDAPKSRVERYRARCPVDGTFIVIEVVDEEDSHG